MFDNRRNTQAYKPSQIFESMETQSLDTMSVAKQAYMQKEAKKPNNRSN